MIRVELPPSSFSRRPRRFRLGPMLAVVALVVVVWAVFAAVAGLAAMRSIRDAERDIRTLEKAVDFDAYLSGELDESVDEAIRSLRDAEEDLDAFVLGPVKLLPFFGRQLRSADALVSSGLEIAQAARVSGLRLRAILDDRTTFEVHEQLLAAAAELDTIAAALRSVDLGPDRGLLGQLRDGRNELSAELNDLEVIVDEGARFLLAFGELLQGPEDNLLLIANNAEMRAGSGMILTTGVLRSSEGLIDLTDLGSSFNRNLEVGQVELTETYLEHFGFLTPEAEWRNLAVTPRFPETAESALRMWEASTGEVLDGVMLVDPFLLQALLVGTGPIQVGDRLITEDNVLEYLLHDQYLDIDVSVTNTERRAEEREVAAAVLTRMHGTDLDVASLVPAILKAADRRHLMLWSPVTLRQQSWADAGVDGELSADSLMVSSSNRSPSKLDYFIEIRAGLTSEIVDDSRQVELQIALDNTVDVAAEPVYVAGPVDGSTAGPGEYVALLTLNLPGAARSGRFDGVDDLSVVGRDGSTRIIATTVRVQPGERVMMTVRFELPLSQTSVVIEPSGRYDPVRWTVGDTRVRDGRRWTLLLDP